MPLYQYLENISPSHGQSGPGSAGSSNIDLHCSCVWELLNYFPCMDL